MNFKQFLLEVKETKSGDGDFGLDSVDGRQYEYERFKNDGVKIGNIGSYTIYKIKSSEPSYAVLDEDNEELKFISIITYDEELNGIQGYSQSAIWKSNDTSFKATDIILDHILKDLKLLVSDRYLTKDGKKMWVNILKSSTESKSGVYVNKTKEIVYFDGTNLDKILDICYNDKNNIFFIFH